MSSLTLYSQGTPNGVTTPIFLEELKAAYGAPNYEYVEMSIRDADIGKVHNQVKSDWFLKINPNGRIPALRDDGFDVFETSAILLYLAQKYDKEHKFSYDPVTHPKEYSEDLQWMFFVHGGIGPMQGQAGHFINASEKIPYAINRYVNETKRLFAVVETRLEGREYLVGAGKGRYGIADIKAFPWIRRGDFLGIPLADFPNIKAWVDRCVARPAYQIGSKVPPI
ncbi:glutathione S-transferase [Ramaria rubella]|nr:glutathione S-transferase [Ramaria rubella]